MKSSAQRWLSILLFVGLSGGCSAPIDIKDTPPKSAASPQSSPTITTNKTDYAPNESIRVQYGNLPGNQQDWITVVKATDPENTYGEWFYTEGKKSGSHQFKGLPVGQYEARVYHNWPEGDFEIQQRYPFTVGD